MKIVGDGDIELALQFGMPGKGAVEIVKVSQPHLYQLLCDLFLAGECQRVVSNPSIVEHLVYLADPPYQYMSLPDGVLPL